MGFNAAPVDPRELLAWLKHHNGATLLEIKEAFQGSNSQTVRVSLGYLMHKNRVYPMPLGRGNAWILVDGKRGRPNVQKLRAPWQEDPQAKKERRAKKGKEKKKSPDDWKVKAQLHIDDMNEGSRSRGGPEMSIEMEEGVFARFREAAGVSEGE